MRPPPMAMCYRHHYASAVNPASLGDFRALQSGDKPCNQIQYYAAVISLSLIAVASSSHRAALNSAKLLIASHLATISSFPASGRPALVPSMPWPLLVVLAAASANQRYHRLGRSLLIASYPVKLVRRLIFLDIAGVRRDDTTLCAAGVARVRPGQVR